MLTGTDRINSFKRLNDRRQVMSPESKARLEVLRSASLNMWIALSDDGSRIVAVGETYREVSERSDLAGITDPLILKTPGEWIPISV